LDRPGRNRAVEESLGSTSLHHLMSFPIPKQEDILQALTGSQWLSTLDALAGFTQLTMDDEATEKLAF